MTIILRMRQKMPYKLFLTGFVYIVIIKMKIK